MPTTVLLLTEDPLVEKGFLATIGEAGGFTPLAPCRRSSELLARIAQLHPDILVLDLPHLSDRNLILECVRACKTIVRLRFIETESAHQLVSAGIRGILRSTLSAADQVECLRKVGAGELWFEQELCHRLLTSKPVPLSGRQGQLVELISQGLKNKEIATLLQLSEGTVKVYVSRLFEKLGVKDRYELALFGLKNLNNGGRLSEAPAVTPQNMDHALRTFLIARTAIQRDFQYPPVGAARNVH